MKARIMKDSGDAIVFYTTRECPANQDYVMSYIRVGQHGEASIAFMREDCRKPENEAERKLCRDLLAEVKSL